MKCCCNKSCLGNEKIHWLQGLENTSKLQAHYYLQSAFVTNSVFHAEEGRSVFFQSRRGNVIWAWEGKWLDHRTMSWDTKNWILPNVNGIAFLISASVPWLTHMSSGIFQSKMKLFNELHWLCHLAACSWEQHWHLAVLVPFPRTQHHHEPLQFGFLTSATFCLCFTCLC